MTSNARSLFFAPWLLLAGALVATSCSSSGGGGTTDGKTADSKATTDGTTTADAAGSACTSYTASTIASMRMGTTTGCFELDNVVSIGVTPSTKSPTLYVEDSAGGDFAAMQTHCESTSTTHPCTVSTTVAAVANNTSVSIKGTYIKTAATHFEEFFIDSITVGASASAPTAGSATVADIARSSTSYNLNFQRVTVPLGTASLEMYDYSPAEFTDATATECSYVEGFGMIPTADNVTGGSACAGSAAQPTGITTPNAAEVLFGTDFYKGFTISTDCRCAGSDEDSEPAATSKVTGNLSGILVFYVPFGATTGYFYLDPQALGDVTMSGLIAP